MTQHVDPERPRFLEYLFTSEPTVAAEEAATEKAATRGEYGKERTVRTVCTVISTVCWVFALVLLSHALLVAAGANTGNAFASFVANWAGRIDLGMATTFIAADERMAVLLDNGAAALVWLLFGASLTFAISHVALPPDERRAWYRR